MPCNDANESTGIRVSALAVDCVWAWRLARILAARREKARAAIYAASAFT